jgi:chorismate mutase
MPGVSDETTAEDAALAKPDLPDRLFAVRGATQVDENTATAIEAGTAELLTEVFNRNGIEEAQMVSCLFTTTEDLDAQFPAVAARKLGINSVPLICAREIPVPGSLPRVIRLMLHYYARPDHSPSHVYLGAAQSLRADLHSAQ